MYVDIKVDRKLGIAQAYMINDFFDVHMYLVL